MLVLVPARPAACVSSNILQQDLAMAAGLRVVKLHQVAERLPVLALVVTHLYSK